MKTAQVSFHEHLSTNGMCMLLCDYGRHGNNVQFVEVCLKFEQSVIKFAQSYSEVCFELERSTFTVSRRYISKGLHTVRL